MTRQTELTIGRIVGAMVALAVCALLPRGGAAELSHDTLWGSAPIGACEEDEASLDEVDAMLASSSEGEAASSQHADEAEPAGSDCLEEDARRSNNVCFEQAGVPASVVPTLAAKVRGLQESEQAIEQATAMIGLDGPVSSQEQSTTSRLDSFQFVPPPSPSPDNSCTVDRQERCRSLPPLPPSLTLEASATAPYISDRDPDFPEPRPSDETAPLDHHEIRPSDGYSSPPLKPPRG